MAGSVAAFRVAPAAGSFVAVVALGAVAGAPPARAQSSLRTQEVVHQRCVNELTVAELTLFGNGTVRLRESFESRRDMLLAELDPEEMEDFLVRLRAVDLDEVESVRDGVEGDWIDQCSIRLELQGRGEKFYRYTRYDTLPLGLKQLQGVLVDLEQLARTRAVHGGLPDDYEPTTGDFVRRRDGAVFEVIGFTSDNRGVELAGLDQPVTIYVSIDDFRQVFVTLEDGDLLDLEP